MKVLGVNGSLRQDSWNHKLLNKALDILKKRGVEVHVAGLEAVPMYNPDVEAAVGFPPAAEAFREAIRGADALVIASPEYNNSVPGVLKNVIDWASRPPNVLFDKPVFIMGASPGRSGAARMHMHLSYILESLGAWAIPQPRVLLPDVATLITPDGQFKDPLVAELLEQGMDRLIEATRKLQTEVTLAETQTAGALQ